ncbi:SCO family protein [Halocynthiibacter styelae]|uniref:SCO family protein n=1 Tax=Halocynthiibacter styelae TaxID=2761955 RepID=A0A8J7ITL9_9RHOB|nr:SCO family protein [Paenihalocynthiibacter styelae]MBI1495441.1 SCO family protein [Paenihalocynthiibacter styelae]
MRRRAALKYGAVAVLAAGAGVLGRRFLTDPGTTPEAQDVLPLPLDQMSFNLTRHDGAPTGPEQLVGRPAMVFFGFTYCPDICPTTLADIADWLHELGPEAEQLNVVFITVDPERDTVPIMRDYVGYFHPLVQGWTGTPDQIARAAGDFRVRYEKVPLGGGDYTMNHTAGVFLFDETGRFATLIDYHEPREFAVPKIRRVLTPVTEERT